MTFAKLCSGIAEIQKCCRKANCIKKFQCLYFIDTTSGERTHEGLQRKAHSHAAQVAGTCSGKPGLPMQSGGHALLLQRFVGKHRGSCILPLIKCLPDFVA